MSNKPLHVLTSLPAAMLTRVSEEIPGTTIEEVPTEDLEVVRYQFKNRDPVVTRWQGSTFRSFDLVKSLIEL